MKVNSCGINYRHRLGYFNGYQKVSRYSIYNFCSPFLYWKDGDLYRGQPGDILINAPNSLIKHGPVKGDENSFSEDFIKIESCGLEELLKKYPLPINQAFSVGKDYPLRQYISRIEAENAFQQPGYNDIIDGIMTELIIMLHRAYCESQNFSMEYKQIYKLRQQIIANPKKARTLEEMAQQTGYSVSRLCQLYNKLFQISPVNDIIAQRIHLAKRLLTDNKIRISEVAEQCGFNSVHYFCKSFRKHTGQSPTEYIKSNY